MTERTTPTLDRGSIPDNRAIGLRDEPYSAYCRVCWYSVYALWLGPESHGGVCINDCTEAHNCTEAMNRAHNGATLRKALAHGG